MIKISTKGRYALRVMIDLARHGQSAPVSLRSVSERQRIPLKYLESIAAALLRHKMVVSLRGKDGGYRLSREPRDYTIYEILCATEGDLAPVSCLENGAADCPLRPTCATLPLWQGMENVLRQYLQSVTLSDLIHGKPDITFCDYI